MPVTELVLYVPGMLDMLSLFNELPAQERPSLTAFERFLARARREVFLAKEPDEGLLQLFGIATSPEQSLPVAPFTRRVDAEKSANCVVMRADPVFLQADRHRLVMLGHAELALTTQQASQLAQEINTHFKDAGWRLQALQPERWYIELDAEPVLVTTPPSRVLEQDVNDFLPQGKDGGYWRGVMNEIQMLLHDHPVNLDRESHAQPPVNSLWLWGNGKLPAQPSAASARWDTTFGGGPLAKGLAQWSGTEWSARPEDAPALLATLSAGRGLILFEDVWRKWREFDVYGGLEWWRHFQSHWLEPLLMAVRSGRIEKLQLIGGLGSCFSLSRAEGRRWWKRRFPELYLTAATSDKNR